MKKITKYIEKNKAHFQTFKILSDDTIDQAETKFNFKFDNDLRELLKYSVLDFNSMELCNISVDENHYLNAYSVLRDLKENNFKLPSDKVVPLENCDEFYMVYSFGDQNATGVYLCTQSNFQKEFESLEQFLLTRFQEEEDICK